MKSASHSPEHRSAAATKVDSNHYLLKFREELTEDQRKQLTAEIASVDFDQISSLFAASETKDAGKRLAQQATAPKNLVSRGFRQDHPDKYRAAELAGWSALRQGTVGVILVAGGEGTRLGFPHPKGQFPIGPVTNKSLYQLLAEQAAALSQRAGAPIPYYVMTSDATHSETQQFFKDHQYFGLNPADVCFFQQGKMPAVGQKTGRVLLASKDRLALSPDGHGGLLDAMRNASLFEDLRKRRLELLFYHQVDNPLARVCDPAFLGFHLLNGSDASTKVVAKEDPAEKVGLLVEVSGRHHIVEYTDVPAELAAERDETGQLRLRCGNIAIHIFRCDFLERMANETSRLPYHRSSKAVPYVDDTGNLVRPSENNAFKFERFIFDILPHAERPFAMEVARHEEFVPLKNREGQFSADHVRESMRRLHTKWINRAGWTIAEELPIEIPPSVALDGADFVTRFSNGEPEISGSGSWRSSNQNPDHQAGH